jgi:hypothetical protein
MLIGGIHRHTDRKDGDGVAANKSRSDKEYHLLEARLKSTINGIGKDESGVETKDGRGEK